MKLIISILCLFLVSITFAQSEVSINLITTKNKLEIGEPLSVKLTIDFPAKHSNKQIVLPIVTDSAKLGEGIEIWETTQPIDTLLENNSGDFIKHIEQEFTIATFDTGMVDLNPLKAIIGAETFYSNAITLTVLNPTLAKDAKLKDLKPIIEDPFTTWEKIIMWLEIYWWVILIIVLVPILVLLVIYILKNRPEKIEIKEIIPLNVRTLDQLDKIEAEKLWQNGKYKLYHSEVTGVIWKYLSERYQIATFEKTSDEILKQLKYKAVSNDQYIQLQKLMQLADLVKFAKTIPTPQDNESALVIAREFIHTTYESNTKKTEV